MVDGKEMNSWRRSLHILMKSQSFDLISGPEKLSRLATPTMGAWNFQTIRRRALLHWPTSYWWHQVSREEKRSDLEQNCYISNISGTTLRGINVSLSIQELGVGTGQRLKKRYWFLWIKMDHCNISSCNHFADIEKLWSRWSSPWTKSSWSNETKAPGIT